ncbi:hypothetical protein Bbelb_027970 [Branchiostoma belcheri]|nr:hypothetical protein Bbelb_027970 [Branchiostoma belcheri]
MRRRISIDVRDASRPATHHEYAGHARLENRVMLRRSSIGDRDCCHEIAGKRTSRVHCVGVRACGRHDIQRIMTGNASRFCGTGTACRPSDECFRLTRRKEFGLL